MPGRLEFSARSRLRNSSKNARSVETRGYTPVSRRSMRFSAGRRRTQWSAEGSNEATAVIAAAIGWSSQARTSPRCVRGTSTVTSSSSREWLRATTPGTRQRPCANSSVSRRKSWSSPKNAWSVEKRMRTPVHRRSGRFSAGLGTAALPKRQCRPGRGSGRGGEWRRDRHDTDVPYGGFSLTI